MKIIGVKKIKQSIFKNSKGDLIKFVSKKNNFFKSFGEVYFNEINCNKKTHPIIKFPSNPIELSINNNGGLIIRKAIMVDLYHPGALPRNNFWTSLNIRTF